MTFSWANPIIKAREKKYSRCLLLAIHNKDFQVSHPDLVKEITNKSIQNNVETKKYVNKIMDKKLKYAERPKPSVVIKRYNRIV